MVAAPKSPVTVRQIKKAVRSAERIAGDGTRIGGTGYTVLKLTKSPIDRLIERNKLGPEEIKAVKEIRAAFDAIAGLLTIRPQNLEPHIPGRTDYTPDWLIDAMRRYQSFANHWSMMAQQGHPLLRIIVATVYDDNPFHVVESDLQMKNGKAEKVVIAGLRDYAARAGWVDGRTAARWKAEASSLFRLTRGKKYPSCA